jgi:hypothetical protein
MSRIGLWQEVCQSAAELRKERHMCSKLRQGKKPSSELAYLSDAEQVADSRRL